MNFYNMNETMYVRPPLKGYIKFKFPDKIPERIIENISAITGSKVISYDEMEYNDITVNELDNMGIDLKEMIFQWGDRPTFSNLSFKNPNIDLLTRVSKILKLPVYKILYPSVNWFEMGLTVEDIITLKPSSDLMKSYGITYKLLLENEAWTTKEYWNNVMKWNNEDWKKIQFNTEIRDQYINSRHFSAEKKLCIKYWGPKEESATSN